VRAARRIVLACAAALLLSAAGAAPALARSADVVDADVELRLARDASLLVTERLTFDYDGEFEGSYRDLVLKNGERIADVQVSEGGNPYEPGGNTALGSHDRPGVFGAESTPDGARIVWHYRAADERRTYEISYRVLGGAVAYDDVIDVGWAVWGNEWDFDLAKLSASLADPALDPADPAYRVWGHPREVRGSTERGDGVATLAASDVPHNTLVEIRVTVPRKPGQDVSGARRGVGDGLPAILAEEGALDDDYNTFVNRAKRWIADHALLLALLLAAFAALALFVLDRLAREHPSKVAEYLPEPPDDATPALAYGLAHEGDASDDTVLATLLDLVDRGYYETSSATSEGEQLDLALTQRADRPQEQPNPYEQAVLEFFDQLLEGKTVALGAMKDRIPEHSELWRGRWERMKEKLDEADTGALRWDRDLNPVRWFLFVVLAVLFAGIALIDREINDEWIPPAVVGGATLAALFLFPRNRLRRVDAEHRQRAADWQAFARWTEDFPRLSDDPPATLEVWKRILVYGVAFGTADRMIRSGRIPAPVTAAGGDGAYWWSYAAAGSFNSASFDGSAFSSGFAGQVAPESSSGGGGGFSGGGGGFSGGGGGGSW
jgi:uncharacterized membrane protein